MTAALLVLRILLAVVLLNAGIGKYAGEAGPVETFDQVGLGQWFRYFTGTIEIASGIGLLIAPVAGLAALAAASVLTGAVLDGGVRPDRRQPDRPSRPARVAQLRRLAAPRAHEGPARAGAATPGLTRAVSTCAAT